MIGRAVAAGLGAWAGAIGVVVHRQRDDLVEMTLPWGVLLAWALLLVAALAAADLAPLGSAWAGGAWTLVVLAVQLGRDVWIQGDALGWSFLGGGLLIAAVVTGWTVYRTSGSTP